MTTNLVARIDKDKFSKADAVIAHCETCSEVKAMCLGCFSKVLFGFPKKFQLEALLKKLLQKKCALKSLLAKKLVPKILQRVAPN
jgi:hypothetical protein